MKGLGKWVAVCLVLGLSGCAVVTGYNREWNETLECCPSDELAGCWEGEWVSCSTGHRGELRAIITKGCGNTYNAWFHALFLKVVPFQYSIPLQACEKDGQVCFRGSAKLSQLVGGTYRTTGCANGCNFHAKYCADSDNGYFSLTRRVGGCSPKCSTCCDK